MSLSDVFRDRHYDPGYVYIAGSLSQRLMKIGTTKGVPHKRNLRTPKYGEISDLVLLCYVWVDQGGKVEAKILRKLHCYQTLRMYTKDGRPQKARELRQCSFDTAREALFECIDERQRPEAWQSHRCIDYDFNRFENDDLDEFIPPRPIEKGRFNLLKQVDGLELSVRTADCLKNENIIYIGDLAQKTETEMLRMPTFGRKSLNDVKEVLAQMGLRLGMKIPGWPKKIEDLFS